MSWHDRCSGTHCKPVRIDDRAPVLQRDARKRAVVGAFIDEWGQGDQPRCQLGGGEGAVPLSPVSGSRCAIEGGGVLAPAYFLAGNSDGDAERRGEIRGDGRVCRRPSARCCKPTTNASGASHLPPRALGRVVVVLHTVVRPYHCSRAHLRTQSPPPTPHTSRPTQACWRAAILFGGWRPAPARGVEYYAQAALSFRRSTVAIRWVPGPSILSHRARSGSTDGHRELETPAI